MTSSMKKLKQAEQGSGMRRARGGNVWDRVGREGRYWDRKEGALKRPGTKPSQQRGPRTPSQRSTPGSHDTGSLEPRHCQRRLSLAGMPLAGFQQSPKSATAQRLGSRPHSGMRLFFFTFNLHRKPERNELHPPGFLCSVQLRKAIS